MSKKYNNVMEKFQEKELKKVRLFDVYAIWTLIFSIVASLAILFGIVYAGSYDHNKTFAEQDKEWLVYLEGLLIIFTIASFIVNTVFASLEAKRASLQKNKYGMIFYILSIFVPFIGFGYHIRNRKVLMYIARRTVVEVK